MTTENTVADGRSGMWWGKQQKVVIREIGVESIERDPNQPRQHFDQEKLKTLAESMGRDGLLQEPAVYPIEVDAKGVPTRFRLIYGERRWLAAKLNDWQVIRCKVVARGDQGTIDEVQLLDRQWSENAERDGLSALEEGRAIAAKVELLRRNEPDTAVGKLIERVGVERNIHPMTARNLVALVDAPESLREALLARQVEKNLAFVLLRHWNKMRKEAETEAGMKRQIKYRNLAREWAAAQGIAFDGDAIAKYAAATAQDVKIARATCKAAEKIESALEEEFAAVVAKAIEKEWTVEEAAGRLSRKSGAKAGVAEGVGPRLLWERTGTNGKGSLVVHLDRLRGGDVRADQLVDLAAALRSLLAEVEDEMGCERQALASEKAQAEAG